MHAHKVLGAVAAAWVAVMCGCGSRADASYAAGPGILVARVQAEFTARGGEGEYRSRVEARVRIRRAADSAGRLAVEMQVDSVSYSGSERDAAELEFMRRLLGRYKASWTLDRRGKASDLREEPELPRGDFTSRLGPLLAAALPVFSGPEAVPGDTQSLFDASEPAASMIQTREGSDRKAGKRVEGRRNCALRLGAPGAGAELRGESDFRFDPALGFAESVELELLGEFAPKRPEDSASAPSMRMRFRYRFELLEVASLEPSSDSGERASQRLYLPLRPEAFRSGARKSIDRRGG